MSSNWREMLDVSVELVGGRCWMCQWRMLEGDVGCVYMSSNWREMLDVSVELVHVM